jgi:hypothetical protein
MCLLEACRINELAMILEMSHFIAFENGILLLMYVARMSWLNAWLIVCVYILKNY